jgi:hypothetical protein
VKKKKGKSFPISEVGLFKGHAKNFVVVMKKNISRRRRLPPPDSSTPSGALEEVLNSMQRYTRSMERAASSVVSSLEGVTGSEGEICGEAVTSQSHARGQIVRQKSITFNPNITIYYFIQTFPLSIQKNSMSNW